MGFEKKPKTIADSIEANDTAHLQAAGRKGAEATNALKRRERERQEIAELQSQIQAEERNLEDEEQRRNANEHIITPDGEDLDYND